MQQLPIKGGDKFAASLGKMFARAGSVKASVSGELVPVEAHSKRATVTLGLETFAAALVCTGAVQPHALRIAIKTAAQWDNGLAVRKAVDVQETIDSIKAEIEKSLPQIQVAASWKLKNGLLIPDGQ